MLDRVEEAIEAIRKGELIIVVDDENRENEGDFICAAELITPEKINFMATIGRGLICAPLEEKRIEELGLEMMVQNNTAMHETAFTVSIDLIGHGCTTGISAFDRATGIKALTNPSITKYDFAKPGHIFPLRAKNGGVLRRTGHTEAAVDLARMAGLYPAGVLVEILNADGSMARFPQLVEIAKAHDLKIISIEDLVAYRLKTEKLIEKIYETGVQTQFGLINTVVFNQITTDDQHIVLKYGSWSADEIVPVKVLSEKNGHELTSFLFAGWSSQLEKSMAYFKEQGKGVFVIMRQSENTLNLTDAVHSFTEEIHDRPENEQRDLGIGAQILREMGLHRINLLSLSKKRRIGILGYGLEIVDQTEI